MTVVRSSRYHQYDTYWSFDDPDQGRLRYREDEFLDEAGTGDRRALAADADRPHARGRASARCCCCARATSPRPTHSARFYREYFRPAAEHVVEKDRRRWLVAYRGVEFYVHLDRLTEPAGRRLFRRGEVADVVAPRRAGQGGDHRRAARAVRRQARRHHQRRLRRTSPRHTPSGAGASPSRSRFSSASACVRPTAA